ncbi:MAG: hypothetical protein CM15mP122_2590 [Bacteroidota bacterium]|nr:MAG: hypothetical protein CM15mP122_2590 [Bacteroidota bacterium]
MHYGKIRLQYLVGDYLLSKGLLLSIENEDFDILKIISVAVREMSQGELLQIEKSRSLDITLTPILKLYVKKLQFVSFMFRIGAKAVNCNKKEVQKMHKLGELIGMAFQIKDDLFDYGKRKLGKPLVLI